MTTRDVRRLTNAGLIALTVAILGGVVGYSGGFFGTNPTYVRTALAEQRTLTRVAEAFGRVQPSTWVTVRSKLSGQVVSLPIKEGSRVQKGDLLARIQAESYKNQIAEAQARVKRKESVLTQRRIDSVQAHRQYRRQKRLYEKEVSFEERLQNTRHALRKATTQLRAARADLRQAQARLEDLRQQKQQTTIQAPVGGVIGRIRVEAGERVAGTDLFPGTRMMRISKLGGMEFRASIGASSIADISEGDTASIQLNAYPGRILSGRVSSVAPSRRGPPVDQSLFGASEAMSDVLYSLGPGYPVRLEFLTPTDGATPDLRTGMGGTAQIRMKTVREAVSVPREAITFRPAAREKSTDNNGGPRGGDMRTVVFLIRNGVAKRTYVDTGIRTEEHIQIRSGIQPGDRVVIGPEDAVQRRLSDGTIVEPEPTLATRTRAGS